MLKYNFPFSFSRTSAYMISSGLFLLIMGSGCKKESASRNPVTYGNSFITDLSTDKARYKPGETITFTLNKDLPTGAKVRYRKLGAVISEGQVSGKTWTWTAPADDYTGYLVDIYETVSSGEQIDASIAVDVSSDWNRFPRYGFLSEFGSMSSGDIDKVVNNLNRYHINGLQFQDWQYKHHMPLAGSTTNPLSTWKDIAGRDNYLSTVNGCIAAAHSHGMKTMFYDLAYGALSDAGSDGVSEQWYLYKDQNHGTKDKHPLPKPPFTSDIFVTNPGNTDWQQYFAGKVKDVYSVFDFDGFQIDQLGDRGAEYDHSGNNVDLRSTFKPFIQAMKTAAPDKSLVMNAVNQFGQEGAIADAQVDFLYTEVWSPNESYSDLASMITNNDQYSNHTKKTVLAAYMDYNLADRQGIFNTPGVLLADAVIFAFGGAHLELGEHMLGKEYFPNSNLQMNDDLRVAIIRYYDFMVAYENLLRGGGILNTPEVYCTNNKMTLNNWPPQSGNVSLIGRSFDTKQVLHFINLSNAKTLNWRDADGTQAVPNTISGASININTNKIVKKVWIASPDQDMGVPVALPFTQSGSTVSFTLPSLKYWDMVVLENQ